MAVRSNEYDKNYLVWQGGGGADQRRVVTELRRSPGRLGSGPDPGRVIHDSPAAELLKSR